MQFAADGKFTRSALRRVTSSEFEVGASGVGLPSIVLVLSNAVLVLSNAVLVLSNAVLVLSNAVLVLGCQASACLHRPSRPRTK
ncbi:hypothetical protein [Rhodopirellula sp. MGV]|uniref:hypothetical protein n=1 Tax=Rhodopirellula sp. MGV TaxID=2023130 RepID=UPI000B963639|nr:hypothetical protein [Rhodopirellula sp. MGV]OYP31650.1 hypothetical protein CGZ80_20785 [Rhodopirellula sp. MGV]PNY36815.1 hypothetical protein C2E31_11075 [Rhodopirellula baltica]